MKHYNGGTHGEQYGDGHWILEQIDKLPIKIQGQVRAKYSEIYEELTLTDPNNKRNRANTWLRKVVDKHGVEQDGELF